MEETLPTEKEIQQKQPDTDVIGTIIYKDQGLVLLPFFFLALWGVLHLILVEKLKDKIKSSYKFAKIFGFALIGFAVFFAIIANSELL